MARKELGIFKKFWFNNEYAISCDRSLPSDVIQPQHSMNNKFVLHIDSIMQDLVKALELLCMSGINICIIISIHKLPV